VKNKGGEQKDNDECKRKFISWGGETVEMVTYCGRLCSWGKYKSRRRRTLRQGVAGGKKENKHTLRSLETGKGHGAPNYKRQDVVSFCPPIHKQTKGTFNFGTAFFYQADRGCRPLGIPEFFTMGPEKKTKEPTLGSVEGADGDGGPGLFNTKVRTGHSDREGGGSSGVKGETRVSERERA